MRTLPREVDFAKFGLDVGNGILNDNDDNIQISNRCLASSNADIVNDTYGDLIKNKEFKRASKCAILSARNVDVDELNKRVVNLLDETSERIYTSIDTANNSENDEIGEAVLPLFLNTLTPTTLPPHELRLRKNCVVMLIRNLNINEGLCNGTRLLIHDMSDHLLKCEILTGDKAGEFTFINRITLHCDNIYPFSFKRRQFPVRHAFVMTINKAQGQTFDKIGLDL